MKVNWHARKKNSNSTNRLRISYLDILCFQEQELHLYDPSLLLKIDFFRSPAKFNPPITAVAPGEPWLKVRPLKSGDYRRGFLQSLSQLTNVGEVSETQFLSELKLLNLMRSNKLCDNQQIVLLRCALKEITT